ncbi:MAG: NAD-dependent epimerase/dehydratase family protein [Bacteroidales bacterium]|nr:NAD-dependent epimerase/dehydratase family protein [Bacteroidales bacterium]
MIKIGITGQDGFIGTHLYNLLGTKDEYQRIHFEDNYFLDEQELKRFVKECDVIVHFAAMNRHDDENVIFNTNIELVKKVILAMEKEKVTPHVLFSSSTQEERDNLYGKSKQKGRKLFEAWAEKNNAPFTGLVIPNVFGPFGIPFYNSFIATFCYQLNNNKKAEIKNDGLVKLIYVGSLAEFISKEASKSSSKIRKVDVSYDFESKVSEVLLKLEYFKDSYIEQGIIPKLLDKNDINLFNTLTSYMDFNKRYPYMLTKHSDKRGDFVEVIKLGIGGQVSFSTTVPGITRGNHYHTRKIERFAVIKGQALIELRKIGTEEKMRFKLDGNKPSYVDIPIWYTHNITNIGDEELYTQFWINEWYDSEDPDTFFEEV